MIQLCTLDGVREYEEGYPVELSWDGSCQRLIIKSWNEGRNNLTSIDLLDLVHWLTALDTNQVLKLLRARGVHEAETLVAELREVLGRMPELAKPGSTE